MDPMPLSNDEGARAEAMLPLEKRELSMLHLIWQDYLAFLGVVFPLMIWFVFWLLSRRDGEPMSRDLVLIAAVITVGSLGVLIWRVLYIRGLFADGREATATISDITFFRDRGRVSYIVELDGEKIMASSAVMKTGRTKALRPGDEVLVLVDRANPKRAIIRRLYTA